MAEKNEFYDKLYEIERLLITHDTKAKPIKKWLENRDLLLSILKKNREMAEKSFDDAIKEGEKAKKA